MGTNFYLVKNTCSHCGHTPDEDKLHIGKSSAGWCFALHVHPERGIHNLEDWIVYWQDPDAKIFDEYGEAFSSTELLQRIQDRNEPNRPPFETRAVPYGYLSWEHFHRENKSEPGPAGMLRHRIDGQRCIGHGEGTWDLIVGWFS